MKKLKLSKQDVNAEIAGKWFFYRDGIRLKIARLNNHEASSAMRRMSSGIDPNNEDESRRILARVVANYVLRDWENMGEDDGKPLAYSPDEAFEIFMSPETSYFLNDVVEIAKSQENFRKKQVEDDSKNSLPPSSGG